MMDHLMQHLIKGHPISLCLMPFWQYCQEVEAMTDDTEFVLSNIRQIYRFWDDNKTVHECISYLKEQNVFFDIEAGVS